MFEPAEKARVFGVAPGVDFPRALVNGLRARSANSTPEDFARVEVIVNTQRMARRIRDLFDQGPPSLLPRVRLLTSLEHSLTALIPAAVSPLRRRFELTQIIARLLEQQPDLAPRASLFDLADSLATLMDEMSGEGVSPDAIAELDVSDQSGHWERAQQFFAIARHFLATVNTEPDVETRQRQVVQALIDQWEANPPAHPIILAGSTGSRGTTMMLMKAIARLPQGALVLPGFDFDTPANVWTALGDALSAEDHPQFRFHRILTELELEPSNVTSWNDSAPANAARNKLVSLALRPAPVTDQWLAEGPKLENLQGACEGVTLVEAASQREEALTIAMRLRKAAQDGVTAALITPDRMLTRQVTAALDRWNILPDDSAGTPLPLTPPGRFLRHVSALFMQDLTSEALLTLLKHPLTHSGSDRNTHLRLTRDLELHLRKSGATYPTETLLDAFGKSLKDAEGWFAWLTDVFCNRLLLGEASVSDQLEAHLALAEAVARGSEMPNGSGGLWEEKAGREAIRVIEELRENAGHAGVMSARDYNDLFSAVLNRGEVRDRDAPHPKILIWGTLEARVQGADLLILGGLNEGSWPESPSPDPWLNRKMRHDAGLLLPERRIGLSAHDFQQAVAASDVWLTRSIRSDEAETVPSRWINRISNLLSGLKDQGGQDALQAMRDRGQVWIAKAQALEHVDPVAPVLRPAPRPPVHARPAQLSVTEIKRLIRDPYSIYARHVLRLRALDPLMRLPDALLRGIVIHEVLETFVKDVETNPDLLTHEHLLKISEATLSEKVPWHSARTLWMARMERVAPHFIRSEKLRRARARPIGFETRARSEIPNLGFTLRGTADRIDRDERGNLIIYDYKTGKPPSKDEQRYFDKQLLLEAAMAERGGFHDIDPAEVVSAIYIGLGSDPKDEPAPLDDSPTAQVWAEFEQLIARYQDPEQGFTSRRALRKDTDPGDYDQLARFGEWEVTDEPEPEDLT